MRTKWRLRWIEERTARSVNRADSPCKGRSNFIHRNRCCIRDAARRSLRQRIPMVQLFWGTRGGKSFGGQTLVSTSSSIIINTFTSVCAISSICSPAILGSVSSSLALLTCPTLIPSSHRLHRVPASYCSRRSVNVNWTVVCQRFPFGRWGCGFFATADPLCSELHSEIPFASSGSSRGYC